MCNRPCAWVLASSTDRADAGPPPVDAAPAPYDGFRELPPFCDPPTPTDEALRRMNDDALFVVPGNRSVRPAGPQVSLGGFPVHLRARGVDDFDERVEESAIEGDAHSVELERMRAYLEAHPEIDAHWRHATPLRR